MAVGEKFSKTKFNAKSFPRRIQKSKIFDARNTFFLLQSECFASFLLFKDQIRLLEVSDTCSR